MEVSATAKYIRVQPRKVRIIADEVRGISAARAASLLRFHPSKSAKLLHKVLMSAVANAANNNGLNPDSLKISGITINEGPSLKRMQARAMGRGNRILKKTSHITVVLEDVDPEAIVKPHGTKAKPRPTFAAPKKKGKAAPASAVAAAPAEQVVEEVVAEPAAEEAVVETAVAEAPAEAVTEAPSSDDKEGN